GGVAVPEPDHVQRQERESGGEAEEQQPGARQGLEPRDRPGEEPERNPDRRAEDESQEDAPRADEGAVEEDLRLEEERSLLDEGSPRRQQLHVLHVVGAEPDAIGQPALSHLGGDRVDRDGGKERERGPPGAHRPHQRAQRVSRAEAAVATASMAEPATASARMPTMITAGSDRVCSRDDHIPPPTNRFPIPFSAISISAPTAVIQPTEMEYRRPATTAGAAAGKAIMVTWRR